MTPFRSFGACDLRNYGKICSGGSARSGLLSSFSRAAAAMAMEIRRVICGPNDTPAHEQQILCVAYNPARRELFTGSADTTIKTWLSETGEHVRTLVEHKGWVTGLAFSSELRVLFSCSIDGRVLVWNKGELIQKEKVGSGKGADSEIAAKPLRALMSATKGPRHDKLDPREPYRNELAMAIARLEVANGRPAALRKRSGC